MSGSFAGLRGAVARLGLASHNKRVLSSSISSQRSLRPVQRQRQQQYCCATTAAADQTGTMQQQDQQQLKMVLVVAVALIDKQQRVLLAQRPEGKAMAGLWEFPGGKVDAGETPEAALCRELQEELNIQVQPKNLQPLTFASHTYDTFHLLMPLYVCRCWRGELHGAEGQQLAWATARQLANYAMPAADIPLVPHVLAALAGSKPVS